MNSRIVAICWFGLMVLFAYSALTAPEVLPTSSKLLAFAAGFGGLGMLTLLVGTLRPILAVSGLAATAVAVWFASLVGKPGAGGVEVIGLTLALVASLAAIGGLLQAVRDARANGRFGP